jgi:hypothetical protein
MYFPKNGIGAFNRTTGTAAAAGADIYDTIDDKANGGSYPTDAVTGFTAASSPMWLRDSRSDLGTGSGGVLNNSICDGTEECVYQDRLTGSYWARSTPTTYTWEAAITYCDGLSYGTYDDWRLPTQKEFQQFMIDGAWIFKGASQLNLSASSNWTATTHSTTVGDAWFIEIPVMYSGSAAKTGTRVVSCVRP